MKNLTTAINKLTRIFSSRAKAVPVQRFLYYDLAHNGNGEDAHYIDIARDLSAMNHRLYRQGMTYHVANATVHDSQGNCRVLFSTAPNTWVVHEAWNAAFKAWKAQRAMVLEQSDQSGVTTGMWSDFKVYLNKEHVTDGDWPEPIEDEQEEILMGAWDYADISFNRDTVRYDNHAIGIMGAHAIGSSITDETSLDDTSYDGYISMIEMLQEVRTVPTDVSQDVDLDASVLLGMNLYAGGAIDDVIDTILDEGDNRPYYSQLVGGTGNPAEDDGAFPARECHIASSYSPIAQVGGFPVPCGLMQIETTAGADNTIGLLLEIAPGPYKGVMAEPM